MAKTFASQASGAYTVQFELVCETASLTKAVAGGGSSVWFVPITYKNRPCYRVFWGHYAGKDEASSAAKEIPMALRGAGAVVVKVPKATP
jgi:septal ring-binding cell division protein DamX